MLSEKYKYGSNRNVDVTDKFANCYEFNDADDTWLQDCDENESDLSCVSLSSDENESSSENEINESELRGIF